MSFSLNINALIPLLTLLQSVLFALLLVRRGQQEERYSDYWLALLLLLMGLEVVPFMLGWLGVNVLWEKFTFLPWDSFVWLKVPTIYGFLKSLTNDQWRWQWRRDYRHFLPFAIIFCYHLAIGGYGLFDHAFVVHWWHVVEKEYYLFQGAGLLYYALSVYYYYQSWQLYLQYRRWIANEFSDTERVSYRWFLRFLICNILVFAANIANEIYLLFVKFGYDQMFLSYGSGLVLTYYVSLAGYAQRRVRRIRYEADAPLAVAAPTETEPNEVSEATKPKAKTLLSPDDLAMWKQKLLQRFEQEQPYLNAELTLSDLAEQMKTNTSVLSQVINVGFEKNFNDFVNQYRINAFQEKIASKKYQHYTMLAVAFDCGFNSKSTFNRAFRKLTNRMPSDLLRENQFGK